nr:NAD(+) synthase [Halostagnicola sp. A56]
MIDLRFSEAELARRREHIQAFIRDAVDAAGADGAVLGRVPDDLVEKTPTAGLWADQTDESELGIDYDTLDSILVSHIDGPLSARATSRLLEVDEETVDRVRSMYEASEHKRNAPPAPEPLE